jgi:hypothetical protein
MNIAENRHSSPAQAGRAEDSPFLHVSGDISRYVVKGEGSALPLIPHSQVCFGVCICQLTGRAAAARGTAFQCHTTQVHT